MCSAEATQPGYGFCLVKVLCAWGERSILRGWGTVWAGDTEAEFATL